MHHRLCILSTVLVEVTMHRFKSIVRIAGVAATHRSKCLNVIHSNVTIASTIYMRRYSAASDHVSSTLSSFPEYKLAQVHISKGEFDKALTLMHRVLEVINHTTGAGSEYSKYVNLQYANILRQLGSFDKIGKQLKIEELTGSYKVKALHMMSLCSLQQGDAKESNKYSAKAVLICESHDHRQNDSISNYSSSNKIHHDEIDPDLLGLSYGMQGLSSLFSSDFKTAEECLQLSARWCQSEIYQMISMNNMGLLAWMRNDEGISLATKYFELKKRGILNLATESTSVYDITDADTARINDCLSIWEECLNSIVNNSPMEKNTMCGPGEPISFINTASSGGGVDRTENSSGIDEKLKSIQFTAAYVTLLCNIAEAYLLLGDKQHSIDMLSSALKAVETHKDSYDCHALFGRILTNLAVAYTMNSQAVTAEGLFRSASDHLNTPYVLSDQRNAYLKANCLYFYGSLLKKWEKRERSGDALQSEANELLSNKVFDFSVTTSPSDRNKMGNNPLYLLPNTLLL